MSDNARTGAADVARTIGKTLWNPRILADAANWRRQQEGKPPRSEVMKAALREQRDNWRATTVEMPDGTRPKIIIHSPAERMKRIYFGVKIVAFVLGIIFAGSIFQFIGQQMAGHSVDIVIGGGKEYARRLGL